MATIRQTLYLSLSCLIVIHLLWTVWQSRRWMGAPRRNPTHTFPTFRGDGDNRHEENGDKIHPMEEQVDQPMAMMIHSTTNMNDHGGMPSTKIEHDQITSTGTNNHSTLTHMDGRWVHGYPTLPKWMKQYFTWHREQMERYYYSKRGGILNVRWSDRPNLTAGPLSFLVVRCLYKDKKCGGTADRLKPLPFYVLLAARMKRVLLFYWERPCRLEEFLVPPIDGVDWRVPSDLREGTVWNETVRLGTLSDIVVQIDPDYPLPRHRKAKALPNPLPSVVTVLYQSNEHGSDVYNQYNPHGPTFDAVSRDCWRIFFEPSLGVQRRLEIVRAQYGLKPNRYVAVHIRSLYQQVAGPKKTALIAKNAINCGSQLRESGQEPIYVTTDSMNSTMAAWTYAKEDHPSQIIVVARSVQPSGSVVAGSVTAETTLPAFLHLDRGTAFLSRNSTVWTIESHPEAYYDTFVDLYLLAQARCRTYHLGNYAKWANLLSDNPSCSFSHFKIMCSWKNRYP